MPSTSQAETVELLAWLVFRTVKVIHPHVPHGFLERMDEQDVKEMWPFDLPEVLERK
jgi:hypothetical protein